MKCKHYKGDGVTYKIKDEEIDLCNECNFKLIKSIFKQLTAEQELTLIERGR